jgi:alpha-1,2-mannosyltransferase
MSFERRFVAWTVAGVAAPLVVLLVATLAGGEARNAELVAAVVGLPMLLRGRVGMVAMAVATAAAAVLVAPAVLAAGVAYAAVPLVARKLPEALDTARGWRRWVWGLVALATVANGARFAAFMGDVTFVNGSAAPFIPDEHPHMCMPSYVQAGELVGRVENVYDPDHYQAGSATSVVGMARWVEDRYEYPPPLIVGVKAGLGLTHDFALLRAGWFALKALLIGAMLLAIAAWIGGEEGRRFGLFLPMVWFGVPVLMDFQFGQAHLLVVVASVTAMVAFAARRYAIGGAMLGAAVLTKVFPGLLVVYLIVQRRWRALAWTAVAMVAMVGVSLVVLGLGPWKSFFVDHLPRLESGEAFAFSGYEVGRDVIENNLSIPSIVYKLRLVGVPGMSHGLAHHAGTLYTLVLLGLTWWLARRDERDRGADVRTWLAILNLAAMRSPLAPGIYVASGTVLMLTLLAASARKRGVWPRLQIGFAWLFVVGLPPLPWTLVSMIASFVMQAINVATNLLALRPAPPKDQGAREGS